MTAKAPKSASAAQTAGIHEAKPIRGSTRDFVMAFIRKPTTMGAVLPSGERLCRAMVDTIDLKRTTNVIEYGPGTGVVTKVMCERLLPHNRFFAIEIEPKMVGVLRRRFPNQTIVEGSCEDVEQICKQQGFGTLADGGGVDAIVSGLPWASFPEPLQRGILSATMKVLKPGGTLVTFGYSIGRLTPAGRRFARLLPEYFSTVSRSRVVWQNVPPAFLLQCRR